MQAILGVIFHFIGGFASGSFYVPYRKSKNGSWESYWIVGGPASRLLVPFLAAYLTVSDLRAAGPNTLFWTCFLGVLWGIALGEWKGVPRKTFTTIVSGIAVIMFSVTLVGYGNSI